MHRIFGKYSVFCLVLSIRPNSETKLFGCRIVRLNMFGFRYRIPINEFCDTRQVGNFAQSNKIKIIPDPDHFCKYSFFYLKEILKISKGVLNRCGGACRTPYIQGCGEENQGVWDGSRKIILFNNSPNAEHTQTPPAI